MKNQIMRYVITKEQWKSGFTLEQKWHQKDISYINSPAENQNLLQWSIYLQIVANNNFTETHKNQCACIVELLFFLRNIHGYVEIVWIIAGELPTVPQTSWSGNIFGHPNSEMLIPNWFFRCQTIALKLKMCCKILFRDIIVQKWSITANKKFWWKLLKSWKALVLASILIILM